jgi:hypothetical protein
MKSSITEFAYVATLPIESAPLPLLSGDASLQKSSVTFGRDWDCISIPQGDAICMRKLPWRDDRHQNPNMTSVTAEVMNNLRIDKEVNDKLRMQLAFLRHRVSVCSLCHDRGSFHEKARSSNGRSVCSPKHRGLRAGR